MVDQKTLEKIEKLMQQYQYNWGKEVDLNCMPSGMTQEKLAIVLERIVETGESVLVGWDQCFLTGHKA